jgi:hypothetical protein
MFAPLLYLERKRASVPFLLRLIKRTSPCLNKNIFCFPEQYKSFMTHGGGNNSALWVFFYLNLPFSSPPMAYIEGFHFCLQRRYVKWIGVTQMNMTKFVKRTIIGTQTTLCCL